MVKPTILIIAKKEFMDNLRNNWIIALSIIFAILAILVSYSGSSTDQSWKSLEQTITGMKSITLFLIPIIGLMLGYASVVGEIEKGSMDSLLSHPVKRFEIITGKFIGLGSVICLTVLIGFGLAGIIIAVNVPNSDYILYLTFICVSILLGLAFLSITMLFSTFFKSRSTSMAATITLWIFFAFFWQMLTVVIILTTIKGNNIGTSSGPPDWFYQMQYFNPIAAYGYIGDSNAPPIYWAVLSMICWIVLPMLAAFWIFRKRDI